MVSFVLLSVVAALVAKAQINSACIADTNALSQSVQSCNIVPPFNYDAAGNPILTPAQLACICSNANIDLFKKIDVDCPSVPGQPKASDGFKYACDNYFALLNSNSGGGSSGGGGGGGSSGGGGGDGSGSTVGGGGSSGGGSSSGSAGSSGSSSGSPANGGGSSSGGGNPSAGNGGATATSAAGLSTGSTTATGSVPQECIISTNNLLAFLPTCQVPATMVPTTGAGIGVQLSGAQLNCICSTENMETFGKNAVACVPVGMPVATTPTIYSILGEQCKAFARNGASAAAKSGACQFKISIAAGLMMAIALFL
ncbi:hypothetical protein BDR26DRAFT_935762 [Obelidium mucronatum]|nr:hypothetical protein BDR26DRAFT_935762 [Obelidium mucronatum]